MLRRRRSKGGRGRDDSLARAVSGVADAAMRVFTTADGRIHFETILSAVAATAGTKVLRAHAGAGIRDAEPGTAVFGDEVHEAMLSVGEVIEVTATSMGIPWRVGATAIPPEHQPHQAYLDLVLRLEPSVDTTLSAMRMSDRAPEVVALAALELVQRAGSVVPIDVVPLLVMSGMVAGAKTVPYDLRR